MKKSNVTVVKSQVSHSLNKSSKMDQNYLFESEVFAGNSS